MRKIDIVQEDMLQNLKELVWVKLYIQNTFSSLYHAGFTGPQVNELNHSLKIVSDCIERQESSIDSLREVRRQVS